jgi:hypothetical protein
MSAARAYSLPYRVCYGQYGYYHADFTTWELALAFARDLRTKHSADPWFDVSLYNTDLMDGAPDARNPTGLTDEQKDEWGFE